MTSTILRSTAAAIAFAGALALATPSMAAMMNFKASLSGKSEVPPNTVAATGSVTATYDTDSKKLTWKGSYSGLTGPATAAHFHGPAPEGKNAGVPDAKSPPAGRRASCRNGRLLIWSTGRGFRRLCFRRCGR